MSHRNASHRNASHRARSSSGSQVLEANPERRHTTGSSRNISMSRQEERLQLRLSSNKHAPGAATGELIVEEGQTSSNRRLAPRTDASPRKEIEQAVKPLQTSMRQKDAQQTPNPIPDENSSKLPRARPSAPSNSLSPQSYSNSSQKDLVKQKPVLDLQGRRSVTFQLPTSSPELVTIPNTPLGRPSSQDTQKSQSRQEWQQIHMLAASVLRADVWDLRSQVHQMRASLREKQHAKAAADDILFRRISYMTARGLNLTDSGDSSPLSGQKSLTQLMDDCQQARNEYGPLEDDCTILEDRLSQQEFKLTRLEEQIYARNNEPQQNPNSPQSPYQDDEPSLSPSICSDDDNLEASGYHPLVNEYLSKLGDLDLMQERLDEFRDEKAALEGEKQSRQRFGLVLDAIDQEWLDDAEAEYSEIIGKIRALEKDLERLKQICLSKNLIDEGGDPTDFQSQEGSYFEKEEDLSSSDHVSEYVKYPLLLPHPGKKHQDTQIYEPQPDLASETAMTRINEWLLDKLRISPLDVSLLASTFESLYGTMSRDWQFLVLNAWYEDDTARMMSDLDETIRSSELSQENPRGSVHVLLAPSTRPPSVLSNDTEHSFPLTKFGSSKSITEKIVTPFGAIPQTPT
ncbi:uncharacterized protein LY89DRAFT_691933 [Mollisia scopiformis]|uniref:Uncharacterized protein n=1 Tax=Mollisia scopiformis TaxID=149040 RepID=A0A132B410_MOLSC|nr:uncharacterized protein LY89DRAFT_691933 [Mollisia scopiformis]KUJ07132.1 hypothetical protein LY89DRAFT_691933 [Mollisia scopiformis]